MEKNNVSDYLKKFIDYIDLFLAGALAVVALFAVGLFIYDVYQLISAKKGIEEGILTVLGSLLILWATAELIHEEIRHLKGKPFDIGAFIMLAIAALIRKVLVYSLSSGKADQLLTIGGVLLALALAYWIIEHAKQKKQIQ